MSIEGDGNKNTQSAKVLKLGLNISVTGDPGTDFEIVLDENRPKTAQSSLKNENQFQSSDPSELEEPDSNESNQELGKVNFQEVGFAHSTGAIPKQRKNRNMNPSESASSKEPEKTESKESSIIDKIRTTMEHFEKFSDHIREIPRLRNHPVATSTPLSDKQSSKSESSLVHSEYKPGKFAHLYDFQSRQKYFKSSIKPLPPDLFLKPLPGENFYKRGIYTRYFDVEPYRHYGSDNSLNKASDYKIICTNTISDTDKYELCSMPSEQPIGILKKSDSESGDKQSTSSADSIKDIKIYQSGGILIMQNFKDNLDAMERKEMSDFSAKLIENCNKLKEEISSFHLDKPFFENYSDENKNSGKTVQFDLTSTTGEKSKSVDSSSAAVKDETSFARLESSESTSDCPKVKDTSPQGTSQSQDFPSLSTQENDSVLSNQPGTSPTFVSPKKLEWDSGADIGYMNLDLTKENLSTIERIVLKGLSSDGLSEKNVVYEKTPEKNQTSRSKFILERIPSDLMMEEIAGGKKNREVVTTSDSSTKEKESNQFVRGQRGSEGKKTKKNVEERVEKKNGAGTFKEASKGENRFKLLETKQSLEEISGKKPNKVDPKVKRTTDKSTNVNTLWEGTSCETSLGQSTGTESLRQTEHSTKVRGRKFSPKVKKLKKKRPYVQRAVASRERVESPSGRRSKSCADAFPDEIGLPKKSYKNVEAIPVLNDAELSKGVEEIVIDQRYKTQKNDEEKATEEATAPETPADDRGESKADGKAKSRPISASSGSNNTVLPKAVEDKPQATVENKFVNQIIQTNELDCESVGVQAFASQISSDCDLKSSRRRERTKGERENVNTSSKNIQAFGLNASLPKQLEHPKESTNPITNQNTKSTQFFGGPVNSLPNYHSNLVTKPGESCGRAPHVLKAKKNLEAEIIRVKEENEKNILANDVPALAETKSDSRKKSSSENKENLINKTSKKRSQSNSSRKTSKGNGSVSQDSDKKESERPNGKAKKAQSVEGSEGLHTSDEVSSLVLTSEVLKVHGDSIDRNIIQEKYFQSQMAEFQLRKMISRSTSMEIQTEPEGDTGKKYTSAACQYSPQSKEATKGERSNCQDNDSSKGKSKCQGRGTSEQYDSSQNVADDCCETLKSTNQERALGGGDSLPSSTQTAHSWVPGMQNASENVSGVGRARSFEYLPGHIYESSGNLREELPSETEQNLITSSSSDSDTAKRSLSERARESEGRNTLVLENSTESSHDSDRLKILDENLTQLNFAVSKLQEKDAQVQSITRTLLANLWKKNGSGDCLALGRGDASKTEVLNNLSSSGKERGDTPSDLSGDHDRKGIKEREISIACQTEEKSSSSEPEKFYEEKRALEKRISEEKKCQIKWIENEIYHLNVLRGLLEKQNYAKQRKKKHSATSNDASKSEENYAENISPEVHPRPVTPVYGCTISVTENALPETQHTHPQPREREQGPSQWCRYTPEEPHQYGMAVSLSGTDKSKSWRRVVMLPVGVQVSLKDANIFPGSNFEETDNENGAQFHNRHPCRTYPTENATLQRNLYRYGGVSQSDVNTQYPSARRTSGNFPSISVQTGLSPTGRCINCNEDNCVCLNLEKSYSSLSRSSRSRTSERRGSSKLTSLSEEPELENEDENDRRNKIRGPTEENFKKFTDNASDSSGSHSKPKPGHSPNCKCQAVVDSKVDLPDNYEKRKSVQNPECRCQNCLIQVSSSVSRSDCRCGLSNIYLNIDKSSSDFGACRCSKSQSQKPSSSACHIIKIHGSKCCSPGKGSCCCKSRTAVKKTENQSCQTDLVKVSPEDSSGHHRFEVAENIPYGRRHPEGECPRCGCRDAKEKTKVDDHPRHYFLRIEETEIDDDSQELLEQKKSLEVITVTVPVKKAGKAKIYSNKFQETSESYQENPKSLEFPSRGCNCCSECMAHGSKSVQEYEHEQYEFRKNGFNPRSVAEKPESPKRDCGPFLRHGECKPYEAESTYGGVGYPSKNRQEFPSREYRREKAALEFGQPETYYSDGRPTGSQADGCKCMRRSGVGGNIQEIQSEYDSHKKSRGGNAREHHQEQRLYEGWEKNSERQQRPSQDSNAGRNTQARSESKNSQEQGLGREAARYNDYYNYNKREFMTKSELMKEEEQKQKVHHPSLQECLTSNRPDFYSSAERRRQIISERAKERVKKHSNRMECLMDLIHRCNEHERASNGGPKRIFTTLQMREQTMKRYKKLPEVTGKLADRKKKEEYRTNKLMADIFAKKLQSEALKGHINLSNSVALLHTI